MTGAPAGTGGEWSRLEASLSGAEREKLPEALAAAAAERPVKVFYVLVCLECGDPEHPLPMPFGSPAERGKWASEHTRGTGHDRWFVLDQEAQP